MVGSCPRADGATVEVEVVVVDPFPNRLMGRVDEAGQFLPRQQLIYRVLATAAESDTVVLDRVVTESPMTIRVPTGELSLSVGDWACDVPCTQFSPNMTSCTTASERLAAGKRYRLTAAWRGDGPPTCALEQVAA